MYKVTINEPLSFLQRMVEDLIYADTLARAVESPSTLEELVHVAAFASSVYAQTSSNTRMLTLYWGRRTSVTEGQRVAGDASSNRYSIYYIHVSNAKLLYTLKCFI